MDACTESLLASPRGRRFCWALLLPSANPVPLWAWEAVRSPTAQRTQKAAQELAELDPSPMMGDQARMMSALLETVSTARYWQPPDEEDVLLQHPAVREALTPVAQALGNASTTSWWTRSLAGTPQHHVQWLDSNPTDPPQLFQTRERLAAWRREALQTEELHRTDKASGRFPDTGEWWSSPIGSSAVTTTGPGPGLQAVGLALVEDAFDPTRARLWPLAPYDGLRAFEITGPDAWAYLAATYPLDLTWSKGLDWPVVTGVNGTWVAPDWEAVAADYDAVHLSVRGYLTTAGRAIPAGNAHSVLAGWDPDATWWLTDSLYSAGPTAEWLRPAHDMLIWEPGPQT